MTNYHTWKAEKLRAELAKRGIVYLGYKATTKEMASALNRDDWQKKDAADKGASK